MASRCAARIRQPERWRNGGVMIMRKAGHRQDGAVGRLSVNGIRVDSAGGGSGRVRVIRRRLR